MIHARESDATPRSGSRKEFATYVGQTNITTENSEYLTTGDGRCHNEMEKSWHELRARAPWPNWSMPPARRLHPSPGVAMPLLDHFDPPLSTEWRDVTFSRCLGRFALSTLCFASPRSTEPIRRLPNTSSPPEAGRERPWTSKSAASTSTNNAPSRCSAAASRRARSWNAPRRSGSKAPCCRCRLRSSRRIYPRDMAGRSKSPPTHRLASAMPTPGHRASPALKFMVGNLPEIIEHEVDGEAVPKEVKLPVTINGRIFPAEESTSGRSTASGQTVWCESSRGPPRIAARFAPQGDRCQGPLDRRERRRPRLGLVPPLYSRARRQVSGPYPRRQLPRRPGVRLSADDLDPPRS